MNAYIIDAVRTPRAPGKKNGPLAGVKPIDLLKPLYDALKRRNRLETSCVDDIILGCSTQVGDQGANIGKISALYAGWSPAVPGMTINRFCTSGLDAINIAAAKLQTGTDDLVVAGGVESLSRVAIFADQGAWFSDPIVAKATSFMHMGISADLIATLENLSRRQLDEYALRSHQRAANARERAYFSKSIVPIETGNSEPLIHDVGIRPKSSLEKLSRLPSNFDSSSAQPFAQLALQAYPQIEALNFLHHAGNSPQLADGASLVLMASERKFKELGAKPRARIIHFASASCEPIIMLTGHIAATKKLLTKTDLQVRDIDLFEVNESFSASVLKYQSDLAIPDEKLNVNGGAIALGHPLGATGGILVGTILDELERRGLQRGIVAICGGAGVAVATLIERV